MTEMLSVSFSFPTVVLSILLLAVLGYWLLVILGALDLDILEVGEIMEGGVEAFDSVVDGLGDVDLDLDVDGDADADGGGGLLDLVGLAGVPLTISLSLLILFAWFLNVATLKLGSAILGAGASSLIFGLSSLVIAVFLAIFPSALLVRPLRPLFVIESAPSRNDSIGKVATVVSGRVDAGFGRAEIADGGAGLLVEIRCSEQNELKHGDKVLLYDFEVEQEVYLAKPADEFRAH